MRKENYLHGLFTSSNGSNTFMTDVILPKVTHDDNEVLLKPLTLDEVNKAVFNMQGDKSPEPDGLNLTFFQHFWDILSTDIFEFCADFWSTSKL